MAAAQHLRARGFYPQFQRRSPGRDHCHRHRRGPWRYRGTPGADHPSRIGCPGTGDCERGCRGRSTILPGSSMCPVFPVRYWGARCSTKPSQSKTQWRWPPKCPRKPPSLSDRPCARSRSRFGPRSRFITSGGAKICARSPTCPGCAAFEPERFARGYTRTYSGQKNGMQAEAIRPTLRFSGRPTFRKSVNRYPPGP